MTKGPCAITGSLIGVAEHDERLAGSMGDGAGL